MAAAWPVPASGEAPPRAAGGCPASEDCSVLPQDSAAGAAADGEASLSAAEDPTCCCAGRLGEASAAGAVPAAGSGAGTPLAGPTGPACSAALVAGAGAGSDTDGCPGAEASKFVAAAGGEAR